MEGHYGGKGSLKRRLLEYPVERYLYIRGLDKEYDAFSENEPFSSVPQLRAKELSGQEFK